MLEWIQSIARMGEGKGTRSTVMHPLLWMIAILMTAFTGAAVSGQAREWVLVVLAALLTLAILMGLVVYCALAFTKPELLRSEKYMIRKMEIEQAAIGDSSRGILDQAIVNMPQLPKPTGEGSK